MNTDLKIPFYIKASLLFVGVFVFFKMLFVIQGILVPLIYASLLAALLSPAVDYLVSKNVNRLVAIAITIVISIAISVGVILLISSQVSMFSTTFPVLVNKSDQLIRNAENWVSQKFNISPDQVNAWVVETKGEIMATSKALIGKTLVNIGNLLIILVLIPVYIFMILYYQPLLIVFIHKLFSAGKLSAVDEVLNTTKKIIQSYLIGLVLEALIVAALNATALLMLGIEYAILLGVIGALLNVVPYIGGIIAVALPMIIALATKSPLYALLVLGAYILIQFIDNHIIIPKVVASQVQINALVSVVVVLAGGALWGLSGMFISIPLTAVIKVICDHIDKLKPLGYLLGDTVPTSQKISLVKQKSTLELPTT